MYKIICHNLNIIYYSTLEIFWPSCYNNNKYKLFLSIDKIISYLIFI